MNNIEEMPLISLVVPVYNCEKYVGECIESILSQDYSNIELILVNDGSKDNSKNIIEDYSKKDKRIKIINQENSGVSSARNNGMKISKGKYIGFIDADDYVEKDYVSYYYKIIKKNNAEIALTPMPRKFNEENKRKEHNYDKDFVEVWTGAKAAENMLYYNVVIAPWNKIISKELIENNNIKFNEKLAFGEGFNFSVDCFQRANKVAVGHKKVYNYRVDNKDSVMTKFSLRLVDGSIEAQETIRKNLVNPTEELLKACKYANWHTYCDCLNTIIGCDVKNKYKDKYKKIRKVCKKDALCVIDAPIPKKDKIKGIMYFISPYFTAKIINHFRIRKFTVDKG